MKHWLAPLVIAGLASVFQSGCTGTRKPDGQSEQEKSIGPKKLTMSFQGLVAYVKDDVGDGVTVLLVDSRTESPEIPAHIPLMTLDSSDGKVKYEVPLVLNGEDIEIGLDPPPATKHLDVDPDVWGWTGSLSKITGRAIKPEILDMTNAPNEVVARVRLEHGTLEVDGREGGVLDSTARFKTAAGAELPAYSTAKVALLITYTVEAGNKITIKMHPKGKMNENKPTRTIDLSAQNLRVAVGNIAAKFHEENDNKDHHFARLYDLVSPGPPVLFFPHFFPNGPGGPREVGPGGVGSRACMGGGG